MLHGSFNQNSLELAHKIDMYINGLEHKPQESIHISTAN